MHDQPRWHNRPVSLPRHIYNRYVSLKRNGCLYSSIHLACSSYSPTMAEWIRENPNTWQHAVLYGAEERR